MNSLLISDLHLTDNPRDEYRWRLFDWLIDTMPKHDVKSLFILGDLTDAKDYHSAKLVNRIVHVLLRCYREGKLLEIIILRGNHDGVDPKCAYFRFLGQYPCIQYVDTPFMKPFDGHEVLMLPHTNDPLRAWESVELHAAETILMHATVRGALAENGQALEGIPPGVLATARRARIYSGDVHVPQKIGRVEYVGAPYPVRFGDKFKGRAVLLKRWKEAVDLPIPSIQRRTIVAGPNGFNAAAVAGLKAGDQIKVRVRLEPSEYGDWQKAKREIMADSSALGLELCGLELEKPEAQPLPKIVRRATLVRRPEETLRDFCAAQKLNEDIQLSGLEILKEVKS